MLTAAASGLAWAVIRDSPVALLPQLTTARAAIPVNETSVVRVIPPPLRTRLYARRLAVGLPHSTAGRLRPYSVSQVFLPARYIGPDGAGSPPAGSRVTAKTSAAGAAGIGPTRRTASPRGTTGKVPALMGFPPPTTTQSW